MNHMDKKSLFYALYQASTESDVSDVLKNSGLDTSLGYWRPYGGNQNNYGVVENQQSSPIAALVEKITNGIDAILMRACIEHGIRPDSKEAPKSIEDAVEKFFPAHKNWDLHEYRRRQAERLQIIADGPKKETSLIIYDDGEGQSPEDFEKTFLSLLRGNKNDVHFVHGKYNMGGAGAVIFCGKRRYQLICSRRFDNDGLLGFTLIRQHPFTLSEQEKYKETWYEYLVIDGKVPSFGVSGEIDLGLCNRRFHTGTIIKLYSYSLPTGVSLISRDLNLNLNEYLFYPALPVLTVEKQERYPKDRNLERPLYGLKRRLEESSVSGDDSQYIEDHFTEEINDSQIGSYKVTCYVFRTRAGDRTAKETQQTIQREFFKSRMAVLFSMNGQVHGHYTSEFITRSLKLALLKNHLLIHVDCTNIRREFRKEIFMASRDRLKDSAESRLLRKKLAEILSKGRLQEIYKIRKSSIRVESKDAEELVRDITRHIPFRPELANLLDQTFNLSDKRSGRSRKTANKRKKKKNEEVDFSPQRFPSYFKVDGHSNGKKDLPLVTIPLGSKRTVTFATDVENDYFDRIENPGSLRIAVLEHGDGNGGVGPSLPTDPQTILDVVKSSPNKGKIRVQVGPTQEIKIGQTVRLHASLSTPEGWLEQMVLIKISEQKGGSKKKDTDGEKQPDSLLGLPELTMAYKKDTQGGITWDVLDNNGISMEHETIVHLLVEGEMLKTIYVNMDSKVLLDRRAKLREGETIESIDKHYVSSVYLHTLFLYAITKNRKYSVTQGGEDGQEQQVEINDYISDLFETSYAQFLLNFGIQDLIDSLDI